MKKCQVGKSKIHGNGVILSKDIKAGETIFLFLGEEITITTNEWFRLPNALQVGYVKWIVPRPNSVGNYLNHSCTPTAGVRGKNRIVAINNMRQGDEVTIDYALSESHPLWHMRCKCKSRNCRRIVKPYQDLPMQKIKQYIDYTSQYLLDMKIHLSWKEYFEVRKR